MCTEKCFGLAQLAATPAGRAPEPAGRHAGPSLTRRGALFGGAAVAASAALGGTAQAGERAPGLPAKRHGLRDLTYPLTTSFPAFTPGEEAVRRTVVTIENDGYYLQEWRIIEHIGTHVDAPGHFIVGGRLSPELRPSELFVEAVVIDIAERAARDPDTVVTVDDLRAFERKHGRIPRDAAVLMYSGWAPRSATPMPTAAPTPPARCTSPASAPTPPSGCCAAGGSAASASTRSASTRATRPRSTRT
jgi:hypothetical protein